VRIANVNPAIDGCPSGWNKMTYPVVACGTPHNNAGCCPTHITTNNIPYSRVCGMVIGVQKGTPNGFGAGLTEPSIDRPYLDGMISITHGFPRKHIWSYAADLSEDNVGSSYYKYTCPCSKQHGVGSLPFVRDNYCESVTTGGFQFNTYFTGDPLWDGKGCGSQNTCCSQPSLPWFFHR